MSGFRRHRAERAGGDRAARIARARRRIRRPPGHWTVLAFCVGALLLVLLVQGVSVHAIGASGTPRVAHGRAPLAHEGPFFGERGGRLVPRGGLPARTVALTFDDGPDPRWTPRIAAYLRGQRGVILLHDGGGNRSETLAAVTRLVPRLRRQGYRFVPVSQLAGLRTAQAEPPATGSQDVRGRLLVVTLAVARAVTDVLGAILIAIAVLAVARALLLFALARRHVREVRRQPGDRSYAPGVSIVVPA